MLVTKYFYKFIKATSNYLSRQDLSFQEFEKLESKKYKSTRHHWEAL